MNPRNNPLPPTELQILQSLYLRMTLSDTDKQNYENLSKGYNGEKKFHQLLTNTLSTNNILLTDLLLRSHQNEFQIDSLLITHQPIYLFEVKNYEGDFYIEEDRWFSVTSGREIRSPILQLQRTEFLLRQTLQQYGYSNPIESYIVFINKEFTLYQAPMNLPIILPSQLKRFINKLASNTLSIPEKQIHLAKKLRANQLEKSSYERIPPYDYRQLQKGIICKHCHGFLIQTSYNNLTCNRCEKLDDVKSSIMRNIREFHFLFPDMKITTSTIHDWCAGIQSKKTIRKVLLAHMLPVGKGRCTHYVFQHEG